MQLLNDKGERYYEDKDDIDMNLVGGYVKVIGYSKSPLEYLRENNNFVTEADGKQKITAFWQESAAFLSSCPHSFHPLRRNCGLEKKLKKLIIEYRYDRKSII